MAELFTTPMVRRVVGQMLEKTIADPNDVGEITEDGVGLVVRVPVLSKPISNWEYEIEGFRHWGDGQRTESLTLRKMYYDGDDRDVNGRARAIFRQNIIPS